VIQRVLHEKVDREHGANSPAHKEAPTTTTTRKRDRENARKKKHTVYCLTGTYMSKSVQNEAIQLNRKQLLARLVARQIARPHYLYAYSTVEYM